MTRPLRVLVVDDTVVYRKIVSDILNELPDVEVVGVAHNGKAAVTKIDSLKPDVLTLDIEMPEMNGLQVLSTLQENASEVGAIMLSTRTQKGSEMTMEALSLGAFDFIPKPETNSMEESKAAVKGVLGPMLKAFARRLELREIFKKKGVKGGISKEPSEKTVTRAVMRKGKSEIVSIGISTGGPNALAEMLPQIPEDLGVPIVVVQHMPPIFTKSLAKSLDSKCSIHVKEAEDGDVLQHNMAFIAPGGKQMRVSAGPDGKTRILRVTDDPPEQSCKPSVDYLFRSVADHYVGRATGVIMTGMGSDGTEGLKVMKSNGALVIAQNEQSCVVYGMPKEAVDADVVDVVAPLDKIALEITKTVR